MEKHRHKPAGELGRAGKLHMPGSISAMPKHLWKRRVWLRGKNILKHPHDQKGIGREQKKADSGLQGHGKSGGGQGARRGRAQPYSHVRVKGHGNAKDSPGKPHPRFPRCHEGTMSVKGQFESCVGLSSPLREPGGDSHPRWETWRRPLVALPGTSLHPEQWHPHG